MRKTERPLFEKIRLRIKSILGPSYLELARLEMLPLKEILNKIESKEYLIIGELGTREGSTAVIITSWLKNVKNNQGYFFTIDWFKGSRKEINYLVPDKQKKFLKTFRKRLKSYEGIHTLFKMESGDAVKLFKDDYFDLFFIDADHTYTGVKRDLEMWFPKVKKGGILCGHDYNQETYNEEYIEMDIGPDPWGVHNGVIKAVNEKFGIPHHIKNFWWIKK